MTETNTSPGSQNATQLRKARETIPHIKDLFCQDPTRGSRYSIEHGDIYLDYSKNLVNDNILGLLATLTQDINIAAEIKNLIAGNIANRSEQRAALHTSLRSNTETAPKYQDVKHGKIQLKQLVDQVLSSTIKGFTGKAFTDVVNIGIGGSDLGPRLVTDALKNYHSTGLRCHFISNIDPQDSHDVLASLNPETTFFTICSKSFSTLETLENAKLARQWLQKYTHENISSHFVAITASPKKAMEFGVPENNILPMWDWVGGRFSLWSNVGIVIPLAIGWENFENLLEGASAIDNHYQEQDLTNNIPLLLALLECYHINYYSANSIAVLPYCHRLQLLPAYLQQLSMESLGKSVNRTGNALAYQTGAVIWGSEGTNGQHSFHQLLHQGKQTIPVDFIAVTTPEYEANAEQHKHLLANCFAQSKVLAEGKSYDSLLNELIEKGVAPSEAKTLARHKTLPGNKPSNTILLKKLNPRNLGSLLAIYEHKIHAQSIIWDINAFDQWGVETGKAIGTKIFKHINDKTPGPELDSSSAALIRRL